VLSGNFGPAVAVTEGPTLETQH